MTARSQPIPPIGEACCVIAIAFGWFITASLSAVASGFPTSGSFSDASLIGLMLTEVILGAFALLFLRFRLYPIKEFIPSPTLTGSAHGALLCATALALWFVLEQALFTGDLDGQPIAEILNNARPSLLVVVALSMLNGLYEEAFLLGYLVRGFAPLGAYFAVGLSMLVRVLYHLYQGPVGALSVLVFGCVVSLYYWRTGRLWPAVFAHTLADVIALT